MGALKYIINKLLLFELCTSNDGNSIKVWIVSTKRNRTTLVEQKHLNLKNIDKLKNWPAIILITGDQVIEKRLKDADSIQKITENSELLWSLYPQMDTVEQTISFVRKELAEELKASLERNNIYILEKWINKNVIPDREQMISDFYKRRFNLSDVYKNPFQANLLSLVVYYKLRLPLLLLLFIILLGNFLLNTRIRQEYEVIQSELYLNQRQSKQQQDDQKKQGRIQFQYQSIPNRSLALIADRIASYIPSQIVLNSLTLSPLEGMGKNFISQNKEMKFNYNSISIKGETEIPGGVSLLTQYLDGDHLFSNVKIKTLIKEKDSSRFTFELNVELKP